MAGETIRDVLIKIRTEYVQSAPPDMQPLIEAQRHVKAATDQSTESIERQNEESRHAEHAHEAHGRGLAGLARPMTMMIHSTMHLAHSFALLTAANEKDGEEMARKLVKYEGWIMGATGVLHMIHAMHVGYEILEKQAWLTAAAEAAALAPLELIVLGVAAVAAVGYGIYKLAEYFDVFGQSIGRAAEESRKLGEILESNRKALADFNKEANASRFEASEKNFGIRVKTDERFGDNVLGRREQLKEIQEAQEAAQLASEDADTAIKKAESRHRQEQKNLEADLLRKQHPWGPESGSGYVEKILGRSDSDEDKAERKQAHLELEKRQQEELKQLGEQRKQTDEQEAALAQRKVDVLAQERDHLRENLKIQKEAVKAAEDAVKAVEEKNRRSAEGFGRLNEAQQAELRRINKKVGEGKELTKQELEHIDKYGDEHAREFAANKYREKGAREGSEAAQSNLVAPGKRRGDEERKSAEARAEEARREMGKMQKELTKKEAELREAGKSAMSAVDNVSKITIDLVLKITRRLEELKIVLEQMRDAKR